MTAACNFFHKGISGYKFLEALYIDDNNWKYDIAVDFYVAIYAKRDYFWSYVFHKSLS